MPKYYAAGWNGNGFLGNGNLIQQPYFYEVDLSGLGVKNFVKSALSTDTGRETMFAIMSDGGLYYWGAQGNRITEPTLLDNSHNYVDGWWGALYDIESNNKLYNSSRFLVVLDELGDLYYITVTSDSSGITGHSVSLMTCDTYYRWSSINIKHFAVIGINLYACSDDFIYIATVYSELRTPTTIYPLPGVTKIWATRIAVNNTDNATAAWFLTANNELYSIAKNSYVDTFHVTTLEERTPTTITRFLTDVRDFCMAPHVAAILGTDGVLKVYGYRYNMYSSPTTNPTNYYTAQEYPNVSKVYVSDLNCSLIFLDNDGNLWASGPSSYGKLGLGTTGNYGIATKIVTQTFNKNSLLYMNALASFVAEPLDVKINLTVWDLEGTRECGYIEDIPSIKHLSLGSYFPVPLILNDINDRSYNVTIQYNTNRQFLGLATAPNGEVVYASGESYDVDFTSDTNLYIVLGEIPSGDGFDVTFYRCSAEKNRINKSDYLAPVLSNKAILRASSSIYKPQLLIELFDVPTFNYCYIPIFQRYYWINDITSVNNGLWLITMSCDRLMSFKSQILAASSPVIGRTANTAYQNSLIPDDQMVKLPTKVIEEEEITNNVLMKNLTSLSNIYMLSVISSADSYVQIMPVSASPTMFVYDGAAHIPTFNLSLSGGGLYAVTGTTTPRVDKGTYSTTFTPATNVYWNDNHGSESRTIQWRIYDPNEQGQFFIIVYDKNYLPYPPDATVPRGQAYTIPSGSSYVPVRGGYTFAGWKDGPTGTIYQPGDVFTPNANMRLTAQWT